MILRLVFLKGWLLTVAAVAQLAPTNAWHWQTLLVWQVPEPVKTITFTVKSHDKVYESIDLQTWVPSSAKAVTTITVTNDSQQKFFKLVNSVNFSIQEIVSVPNYLPANSWMTNYNIPDGFDLAMLNTNGLVTRILNNVTNVDLVDGEVEAHLIRHWKNKQGERL